MHRANESARESIQKYPEAKMRLLTPLKRFMAKRRRPAAVTGQKLEKLSSLTNSISTAMDESTSSADLELLLREIQVLEEENFVLTDAQETIEASLSSPKAHSEQGDLNAPSGHKVRLVSARFGCHMHI